MMVDRSGLENREMIRFGKRSAHCAGVALSLAMASVMAAEARVGDTAIERWQDGKQGAVSITYDGGTINQFKVALPIMNELGLKASFFIVTGDITGSRWKGEFIGRPVEEILEESVTVPLKEENFFERATAVRYLGYEDVGPHHTRAGDFFELGKFGEAYSEIDEAYMKVRRGEYKPLTEPYDNETVDVSWDELKVIAAQGHEFASHSVSHPQLAICDDQNILFELEKSRDEILEHLGPKHTFSHECPHGSENPRVMKFALSTYPVLRNRMPEPFLAELNRWNKTPPGQPDKEYVQWQRGPKTSTTMEEMKSWMDTTLDSDKIWLVLVFHGVDGIGYQPKTGEELKEYFTYLHSVEDRLWVATFRDVAKYLRERMYGQVRSAMEGERIQVNLTHSLDAALYDLPLTLKTRVPAEWSTATVTQGETIRTITVERDDADSFILYQAIPNAGTIEIRE